jgi:carboxymethylenebutenolidase
MSPPTSWYPLSHRSPRRRRQQASILARTLAVAAALVLPPVASAGTMITIPSGSESIQAYVAAPDGAARKGRPAVVVVQEWWGLDPWVKSVADRLAAQGYVAIAPDLYRGQVAGDAQHAHELLRGLPDERARRDIRAAAAHVRSKAGGEAKRVGVIGFCMGGRLALLAALDKGPFDAVVVAYGSPETNPARLKTLRAPVLGIFGGADRGIGRDQTAALEAGLRRAGRKGEVIVYPGAQHGFLNDARPQQHDPASSLLAWAEVKEFLAEHLKK